MCSVCALGNGWSSPIRLHNHFSFDRLSWHNGCRTSAQQCFFITVSHFAIYRQEFFLFSLWSCLHAREIFFWLILLFAQKNAKRKIDDASTFIYLFFSRLNGSEVIRWSSRNFFFLLRYDQKKKTKFCAISKKSKIDCLVKNSYRN